MNNKRFIELLDSIRMLDGIDMMTIETGNSFDYNCIKELESIYREFYLAGHETGQSNDIQIDFENRLSNFYQFGTP